uniref:Uncharacterized protein n=1 Tax=Kalanchoe fedtschenkoi TaxID=63787 RepID=A0A7N0RGH4_KALFE
MRLRDAERLSSGIGMVRICPVSLGKWLFPFLGFDLFFMGLFSAGKKDQRRSQRLTEESEHTQSIVQRVLSAGACSLLCLSPHSLLLSFLPSLSCCNL